MKPIMIFLEVLGEPYVRKVKHMNAPSRRTTLAMLGLVPATAVGAETMIDPKNEPTTLLTGHDTSAQQIATALHRLAEQIEAGAVLTERLDFSASLAADTPLMNVLTVSFWHNPEV